jgi:hypothetical protein
MNKVSITQAAKMVGISRSYLYRKYINTGVLSVVNENSKKVVDVSELIRVFGSIQVDSEQVPNSIQSDTVLVDNNSQDKDQLIAYLKCELAEFKVEAKIREEWFKQQLEKTTNLLENKQPQEPIKRKKFLGIF